MKSIIELQSEANRLRQRTEIGSISPEDTFGLHKDTLDYIAEFVRSSKSIGIRKVYISIAAMITDGSRVDNDNQPIIPDGTDGRPLKFGQIVAVYDPENPTAEGSGNIYVYQANTHNPWLLVGNIFVMWHDEIMTAAASEAVRIALAGTAKGPKGDRGPAGEQGPQGDTIIIGNEQNYTLYNVEGVHTDGAMTQEAVTKALEAARLQIKELQAIVANIGSVAEGYVRVAGSSSPALSYKSYKKDGGDFGTDSVFSIFYPCLVGTKYSGADTVGKIICVLQKFGAKYDSGVNKWEDLDGNLHVIDGTEGDVMICNIVPYYRIMGKREVNGVMYDVFLMSILPFSWQGYEAEKVERYGQSPDYCVSHTDSDGVTRMHSVYNPSWNGSYSAPQGVVGSYRYAYIHQSYSEFFSDQPLLGGAGGLHTTDLSLPAGELRAMNNNNDTTKTVPWMNATAAMAENLMALIIAEGGTFDAHNAALMGSGFSCNDPATSDADYAMSATSAKNGLRVKDKNDNWRYYSLGNDVRFLVNGSSYLYAANVINAWRNPWHIMEAQRAMSYAVQHHVHELEWFVFDNTRYKWRSVDGFAGPEQGEMTCVLFKLMATKAGDNAVDPTDGTTSIAGNRVEILLSTAMIHGMTTQVSPCWWTSGLLMSEYEDGLHRCYMERDQSQLMPSSPYGDKTINEYWDFERQYNHVVDLALSQGYAKDYHNDALMLPQSDADNTGGGLHTYIGKYTWLTGGKPAAGKKTVRGFLRGVNAYVSVLSPLSMYGNNSPSLSYSGIGFGTCVRIVG